LVEQRHGKAQVVGSIPTLGSDMKVSKRHSPNGGNGVFADISIASGEKILKWKGEVDRVFIESHKREMSIEHITHIRTNKFTTPSGDLDDYVNHSCEPNCGLIFGEEVWLTAIRDILPKEELTFDYSTTINKDDLVEFPEWKIQCECGSGKCRRIISSFDTLPKETQDLYRSYNILPDFLR
jgi:SET domain-containing protein